MKNKVILTLAAVISLAAAGYSMKTQAMTTAYESEDGTIEYHTFTGNTAQENENFRKQENKDSLAFLKEYGVTYDVKKDAVYYGKEKVRWLIDEKSLGNCIESFYTKGGTIDVYTVRNKDGAITGVRKATEEEFNERDEQKLTGEITGTVMELVQDSAKAAEDSAEAVEDSVELVIGDTSGATTEYSTDQKTSADQEISADQKTSIDQETFTAQEASTAVDEDLSSEYNEQMKKREEEYAKIGIGKDQDGCWTWKGKRVYLLLDYDGGLTVFGSEKAKKDKIYLYVSRDEDGNVLKAEAVSAVEILEKKALQDASEPPRARAYER